VISSNIYNTQTDTLRTLPVHTIMMEIYQNTNEIKPTNHIHEINNYHHSVPTSHLGVSISHHDAFDDHSDADDNWGDDFSDTEDEEAQETYGNTSTILYQKDAPNEQTIEEDFYSLPEPDEIDDGIAPKISRDLKPQLKPPKPQPKPFVKQKPTRQHTPTSYDNHRLKKESNEIIAEENQSAMFDKKLSPFNPKRNSRFPKLNFGSSNRPPSVAQKPKNTLTISSPQPKMVSGQPYKPPPEPKVPTPINETANNNENWLSQDDFYVDPMEDEMLTSPSFSHTNSVSSPSPISGNTFMQRLNSMKKQTPSEEETYEVFDEGGYNQQENNRISVHSDHVNARLSQLIENNSISDNSQDFDEPVEMYEVLGNGMSPQLHPQLNTNIPPPKPNLLRPNSSTRPPAPLPDTKPAIVNRKISPKPSTELELEEEYHYVPSDPAPIFPHDASSDVMLPEDDVYEEAEGVPKMSYKVDDRKQSLAYIVPMTTHTADLPPVAPERSLDPVKLTPSSPLPPGRPPKKLSPTPREHFNLKGTANDTSRMAPVGEETESNNNTRPPIIDRSKRPAMPIPSNDRPTSIAIANRRSMPLPEDPPLTLSVNSPVARTPSPMQERRSVPVPQPRSPVEAPLSNYPWYHAAESRTLAKQNLEVTSKEGDFIIRTSSKDHDYSISLYHGGSVTHLKIPLKDGYYHLGTSAQRFSSIPELVVFYQKTKVVLKSGGRVLLSSDF